MNELYTDIETVKSHLQEIIVSGSSKLPWDVAEDVETLDFGRVTSSDYKRKRDDVLSVELYSKVLSFSGPIPCGGSGVCQTCGGEGQHIQFSHEWAECETCNGSGDCPCQFDKTAHPGPHA